MGYDLLGTAVLLGVGNIVFRRFYRRGMVGIRVVKAIATLLLVALISFWFGHLGVCLFWGAALVVLVYVHGVVLPRKGIHGITAEPRAKYFAMRGWEAPED
jgi:hypothetical protein